MLAVLQGQNSDYLLCLNFVCILALSLKPWHLVILLTFPFETGLP